MAKTKTFESSSEARASEAYAQLRESGKTDSEALNALVPSRTVADDAEPVNATEVAGVSYEQRDAAVEGAEGSDSQLSNDDEVKPLEDMTADELMVVAQRLDLPGRSTMDKETLLNALVNFEPDSSEEE